VINFGDLASENIVNAFVFIMISSSVSFLAYYSLGSTNSHKLYYKENLAELNLYKMIEYGISAPMLILAYTSLIPIENWYIELTMYFGLSLNVFVGYLVVQAQQLKQTARFVISSLFGSLITLSVFGYLLYKLFQTSFEDNLLVYVFISIFAITRLLYFKLILQKPQEGEERYVWLSKGFINMDFLDRVALIAFLMLYINIA
jgi:hypothetical protein